MVKKKKLRYDALLYDSNIANWHLKKSYDQSIYHQSQ